MSVPPLWPASAATFLYSSLLRWAWSIGSPPPVEEVDPEPPVTLESLMTSSSVLLVKDTQQMDRGLEGRLRLGRRFLTGARRQAIESLAERGGGGGQKGRQRREHVRVETDLRLGRAALGERRLLQIADPELALVGHPGQPRAGAEALCAASYWSVRARFA